MAGIIGTAIYAKNVPVVERVARFVAGAVIAVAALAASPSVLVVGVGAAMGVFIAFTGFVGFCPACYLMGRRLVPRKQSR